MRVFVEGAGGAFGTHVVCRLVADGHEVIGFTRSSVRAELVRKLGASRVITGDSDSCVIPLIHIEDAAAAVVAALSRGRGGEVYNIVDDEPAAFAPIVRDLALTIGADTPRTLPKWLVRLFAPYAAAAWLGTSMRVSNVKAKQELQWKPRFSNYRVGVAEFCRSDNSERRLL